MRIKKIGHCCLVVEEASRKVLTDPGSYTDRQNSEADVDAVLITHEHPDHMHIESLKKVLKTNPSAEVYTNKGVGKHLKEAGIAYSLLEHGQSITLNGVSIEAFGERHAPIYTTVPDVLNTGYMIGGRLFYPGDAFYVPKKKVEILALPVAGPWMRISEAIDYAKEVHPKACFPVHDGMRKLPGASHMLPKSCLAGIDFIPMESGAVREFQ